MRQATESGFSFGENGGDVDEDLRGVSDEELLEAWKNAEEVEYPQDEKWKNCAECDLASAHYGPHKWQTADGWTTTQPERSDGRIPGRSVPCYCAVHQGALNDERACVPLPGAPEAMTQAQRSAGRIQAGSERPHGMWHGAVAHNCAECQDLDKRSEKGDETER